MKYVYVRIYGPLNDFLPSHKKQRIFRYPYQNRQSVKDVIESINIPHVEVVVITVNSHPVDFTYIPHSGDFIYVYPEFFSMSLDDAIRLTPILRQPITFVLDVHLGKLACWLRLAGFDAVYKNNFDDQELAEISKNENRYLLTKDHLLLKRKQVVFGYYVRTIHPKAQMKEVINRFQLENQMIPMSRCSVCNGILKVVSIDAIRTQIPLKVRLREKKYKKCAKCGKIYWTGTHSRKIWKLLQQLKSQS